MITPLPKFTRHVRKLSIKTFCLPLYQLFLHEEPNITLLTKDRLY
jgi:hypothetical protein